MKEKELNLSGLLKGCEGEIFYSLIDGEVKLHQVVPANQIIECQYHAYHLKGHLYGSSLDGTCLLWPSRALHEKYPLDAYSAWMEWEEAREPKRWRAKRNKEYYYFLDYMLIINDIVDNYDYFCDKRYEIGNYFRTKEEAEQAAEVVKEALMKFHKQNTEK